VSGKRGKMLVIRGGAIGDFILTLPAITALRETFPDTHLELLGYPALAELARVSGLVDAYRSIEARPLARFFARNATLDPEWSAYFESFNLIISYLYDPDDIFKTNIGRASKAQFIQGQHRPNEAEHLHATAVFLKPLEKLAIYGADPVPRINISAGAITNRIALHPGSGSEKKNWPEEKWSAFIAHVKDDLLLVGGEAEGERLNRLRLSSRIEIAQNLPLAELAARLAGCRAFVGHDSGITHLAAALGLPTVALWGPSNDRIWRPLHARTAILKPSKGLEELPVGEVISALPVQTCG
jgi:heptosyltransferase III